jgi:monovalent cation/hydrogen antiporter
MAEVSTVLGLLFLVTILALLTRRWTIPYPTVMVIAGLMIALVPGLPRVQLTPNVVFLIFLPPLLYAAAWNTSWSAFKQNLRPITLLAVGLILATTIVTGLVAKSLYPPLPWAAAFALGAIISPPDAIAATSLTRVLPIPRRIVVILEGESLLNDATSLVAYRVAIGSLALGSFSIGEGVLQFGWATLGGIAIGLLAALAMVFVHRRLEDPTIETTLTLLTPYAIYVPCESLHVSGVLAVVVAGLYLRQRADWLFSSATRLHARSVWENVIFVLNGLTFIFIGLGLRDVVEGIPEGSLAITILYGVVILALVIVLRIAWVFPVAYLTRTLIPSIGRRDPLPPWSHLWIIAWTGMRGVVSLAAALALPLDFPQRSWILLVVFVVILGTLVVQSLSLPWMIRVLGVSATGRTHLQQELDARLWALAAANAFLENTCEETAAGRHNLNHLRNHFELQANRVVSRLQLELELDDAEELKPIDENESQSIDRSEGTHQLHLGALQAQRGRLQELQDSGMIEDELSLKLNREIDLEEAKLHSLASFAHRHAT